MPDKDIKPFDNIVHSKSTPWLLTALIDFLKLKSTGILETPSNGREIFDEFRKEANLVGFGTVSEAVAVELVKRLLSDYVAETSDGEYELLYEQLKATEGK